MRSALDRLAKHLRDPVYAWRPRQIARRFWYWVVKPTGNVETQLPWGASLKVIGDEQNGRAILQRGVDQLIVTEACIRLMEPGKTGVDIGSNYGQMANALIHGAQAKGTVYAFEPHPFLFEYLSHNMRPYPTAVPINRALSEKAGTAALHVPRTWKQHAGTSSLEAEFQKDTQEVEVAVGRLDDEIENPIHVLKVDVERHELKVLRGASQLLSSGAITHVIFEDHDYRASKVVKLFEQHGYDIYSVKASIQGPKLTEPRQEAWNFVATLDAQEAREKFASPGWRALGDE